MKLNPVHKLALFFVEDKAEEGVLNQKFWSTNYGYSKNTLINDLKKLSLIKFGFDIDTSLNNLKVNELKEILKDNNLKQSGNKPALIERIAENASTIKFNSFPSVIILTDKGKEVKDSSNHILFFHKNFHDFDIFTADQLSKKNPSLSSHDVILKYINTEMQKDLNDKRYSSASILSYNLANYLGENNEVDQELKAITLGMAFAVLQELYYIDSSYYSAREEKYDSNIVSDHFGLRTKFRSLSSKHLLTDDAVKSYIYNLLEPVIDENSYLKVVSEIVHLAINNEDLKIDQTVKNYRQNIKKRSTPKIETMKNDLVKETNKNSGCGCLFLVTLPIIPILYLITEVI